MNYYGFEEDSKGKTSGSRVIFFRQRDNRKLMLHKPHPGNELFHQAVDDYLLYCEEKGIEPDKTFSGKFNVRISPELHRKAVLEATKQDVSLNNIVQKALKELLYCKGSKNGQ